MNTGPATIVAASIDHVARLTVLLDDLAAYQIAMYDHQYDALVFGSFQVTLGLPLQRVRFIWEGRDATLSVACQTLRSQLDNAAWVHDAYISVPDRFGVYAEIASEACRILTT